MSGYKSLDELEVVLRSGAGIAIICEGEDYREDEFFYKEWFGHLGRSVTFHAQDGWKCVQDAVMELRRRGTPVPVYGLLDRNFTSDEEIARQMTPSFDGACYRLPRYDLESYLLDPEGWLGVVRRVLWRREGHVPPGWDTTQAITERIHDFYRQALPIAAHNWSARRLAESHATQPGFTARSYITAIQALATVNVEDALGAWASAFGADTLARQTYLERLAFLQAREDDLDELQKHVSGKLVFQEIHRAIPCARKRPDRMDLAERYLDQLREPPPEIAALIDVILSRAERDRSR
ncbi:uncharacterized protein SOCEGT47_027670 [Sorangium cellulosum]|uniref:DUF4435 domain-containing protein n=1 Tax=Sorangium cellulosum TaxID=56 RepID=A0A4P2Q061_SORCE|nr:hypothetical protein [Sorangium cellulosum]AUX22266.1 uncharacterized protein SOCEGT47_027670 [Sorangium cellulosum]